MTRKPYNNPPVIEAVCEFRFDPSSRWDPDFSNKIHEKIKSDFPTRKQAKIIEVQISTNPEKDEAQVQSTPREQFVRKNETALIQVSPFLLAINRIKPYKNWDEFHPLVLQGLKSYLEVVRPESIVRMGLRYINIIEVPLKKVELKQYFHFFPSVGPDFPKNHGPFIVGAQFPFEDGKDVMKLELTNAKIQKEGQVAFTLDIDYSHTATQKVDLDEMMKWVHSAHARIENTFEASITEDTRNIFKGAK